MSKSAIVWAVIGGICVLSLGAVAIWAPAALNEFVAGALALVGALAGYMGAKAPGATPKGFVRLRLLAAVALVAGGAVLAVPSAGCTAAQLRDAGKVLSYVFHEVVAPAGIPAIGCMAGCVGSENAGRCVENCALALGVDAGSIVAEDALGFFDSLKAQRVVVGPDAVPELSVVGLMALPPVAPAVTPANLESLGFICTRKATSIGGVVETTCTTGQE